MVVDDQRHAPAALSPGWHLGIRCQRDWMHLWTGLDGFGSENICCLFQVSERPTVAVCTDSSIPVCRTANRSLTVDVLVLTNNEVW